jgi:hypothetical protein
MSFPRPFFAFVFILAIFILAASCGNNEGNDAHDSINDSANTGVTPPQIDITVQTFIVKDSADKQKGWGYELYVDGKKTISQPIIPAVPGNDAFATEEDAKKIGELARQRMQATGSFPTITIRDLDSLGINHK